MKVYLVILDLLDLEYNTDQPTWQGIVIAPNGKIAGELAIKDQENEIRTGRKVKLSSVHEIDLNVQSVIYGEWRY